MDKAMCLSTDQLRAVAAGSVSSADFAAFERHLNECRDCQARLASHLADPFATRTTPADAQPASPVSPTLAAAVANLPTAAVGSPDAISWIEIDALPGASSTRQRVPINLGPVRLIREIGRGGMGAVWLGRHEMLQRDVAVKFLLAPDFSQSESLAEFLAGAQAAAAVRHLGLTSILHADQVKGLPYLAMVSG